MAMPGITSYRGYSGVGAGGELTAAEEAWVRAGAAGTLALFTGDDVYYGAGNTSASPDVRWGWNTTQTVDGFYLGLSDGQNTFIIAENGDRAFDFAHGAQTNPTVFIHSANQNTGQWIGLFHSATNAVVQSGTGDVRLIAASNEVRLHETTGVGGLRFPLTTTSASMQTDSTANATIFIQNQTFTAGATHSAVQISPTWTAENQSHTALNFSATQNGANSSSMWGIFLTMNKATGGSTLANMFAIQTNNSVAGTVTTKTDILINGYNSGTITTHTGLQIGDFGNGASVTTSYAIDIQSQTQSVTTSRAINIAGTGVNNAIRLGNSPNIYSSGAEVIRFTDSTNAGGFVFTTTAAGDQTINGVLTGSQTLLLQNQTFTLTVDDDMVQVSPTYVAGNFNHNALRIAATQNGANSAAHRGISIDMTKATGATVLASMSWLALNAPSIAGTVTDNFGLNIANLGNAGATNTYAIYIASQSGSVTLNRAIEIVGTGVGNAIRLGSSANIYANAANNIRFMDSTNANGLFLALTAAGNQSIRTVGADNTSILLQDQTLTLGGEDYAVEVQPTYASENFIHGAFRVNTTQNGANTTSLRAITVSTTKATGATTLANIAGVYINTPSVTGTVTTNIGIDINNQSPVGGTTASAIRIASQSANATTTRAIELVGTGVTNAILFTSSANVYANAAGVLRYSDTSGTGSVGVAGIDYTFSTTNTTINTFSATTHTLILQNATWAAGTLTTAVQILPTWATANQSNTGLTLAVTQNGANSTQMVGQTIAMTKATGATTLGSYTGLSMTGAITGTVTGYTDINITPPTGATAISGYNGIIIAAHSSGTFSALTGIQISDLGDGVLVTASVGLQIMSQTASVTSSRAIELQGTGISNAIEMGNGLLMYANSTEVLRITDSTNVNGLSFTLAATASQTINTITATTGTVLFQNQTFTAGATHSAVQVTPTWATENQNHRGLNVSVTQNGANADVSGFGLEGIRITTTKDANASTLITMIGLDIVQVVGAGATVTTLAGINIVAPTGGTVVNAFGIDIPNYSLSGDYASALRIQSQSANATTTRAIDISGTGRNNAIRFGAGLNVYANSTEVLRVMNSTDARGFSFTMTAAGNQTLAATAGTLMLTAPNIGVAAGTSLALTGAVSATGTVVFDGTTATTGNGAVAITGSIHEITTNGVGNTLTLADGTEGQTLRVVYVAEGAGADTAILTPTNLAGAATTITFAGIGDAVNLLFTAGTWFVVGANGVVVA